MRVGLEKGVAKDTGVLQDPLRLSIDMTTTRSVKSPVRNIWQHVTGLLGTDKHADVNMLELPQVPWSYRTVCEFGIGPRSIVFNQPSKGRIS